MLFRKKIQKSCSYCAHGTCISDNQILCIKKGSVSVDFKCRKFRYDPCKRIPGKMKLPDFSAYHDDDFSL